MVYRVAGYVKLAKLWEKRRDAALKLHNDYFRKKYENTPGFELVHVYVDITGQKTITKRREMIQLLKLCVASRCTDKGVSRCQYGGVLLSATFSVFLASSGGYCYRGR